MQLNLIRQFLRLESASGIILVLAAIAALIFVNSPLGGWYQKIFQAPFILHVINEGLMTIFFLLVGLELKREFLEGELSDLSKILLPAIAALGGMLLPALIYMGFNWHDPIAIKGWAIPVATDIAFALGVLSLFGRRIPLGLKLFLMALAIFDDLGAIIILAIFYSKDLSYLFMLLSALCLAILFVMNKCRVNIITPYFLVGIILWFCVLKSGVHATIAGVLLSLMIPISPLKNCEKLLHPWVAYLILPLFAFANTGFSLMGITPTIFTQSIPLGIIVGLFLGKQVGVFSFAATVIRCGWASLPEQTSWLAFYGVAILCGIGFTMSLFLGTLSFQFHDPSYLLQVKLSVLAASVVSAVVGALVLIIAIFRRNDVV